MVAPQLVVTSQPTSAVTAGDGFPLTVTAETYLGTVYTAVNGTVTLSITSGPATRRSAGPRPRPSPTVSPTSRTSSWTRPAPTSSTVTSGNLIPGSANITVVAQTAVTGLYFSTEPPSSVQAGQDINVVVGGVDQFGNATALSGSVTLAIGTNLGGSTLGGTTTETASDGVATFSDLTLNKVGTGYTLIASLTGVKSATSSGIDVTPAAPYTLAIPANGEPAASVAAGQPVSMVVDVEDQYGNLETGFSGPVGVAALPGTTIAGTTSLNASGGVATFGSLVIDQSGIYQLVATNPNLVSATSSDVTVTPAAVTPVSLAWSSEPSGSVFRNFPFDATIVADDKFGNVDTDFTGNIVLAFKSNPGNAILGGTTTIAASAGTAAFSGLKINVADDGYTLVATGGGLTSPISTPINVSLDPAVGLKVSLEPQGTVQAGSPFGLNVTALDASGNADPDFSGSVSLAVTGPPGTNTLGGTTTMTAGAGVAVFTNLTLKTVGTYTLTATSASLTGATATTTNIVVTPGPAAQLVAVPAAEPPPSVTAGVGFGFDVKAEDAEGNLVTGFNGVVAAALTSNPGNATASGALTAVATGGEAFFTGVIVDKAGTGYTINATSTTLTSATTNDFNVVAAAPRQLAILSQPTAPITAGTPFVFNVAAEDAFGNVAAYSGQVTIALVTIPIAGDKLSGTLTMQASNGDAPFSGLQLDTAGVGYTIQATSIPLTPVTSSPITSVAGKATQLVVAIPPPKTMGAGVGFGLQFDAEDAFGNIDPTFDGVVTFALENNPNNAILNSNGPLTVTAVNGVANTLDPLTVDTAGAGYTIQATSPGLTPANTIQVAVTPQPATHLVVTAQPPMLVPKGSPFGFVVAAEDQYGNVDTGFDGQVVVAAPAGSGAVLGGTTTLAAGKGNVSFAGLTLSNATAPVALQVTGTGLVATQTIPVTLVTAAQVEFTTAAMSVNEDAGVATFQIVRSGGLPGAISVNVATSGGTAAAGVNYTPINQVVNFASGQDSQTVSIPIKNAGVLPTSLTVNVGLSSPGGGAVLGTPSTSTLTILNVGQSGSAPLVTMESVVVKKKKGAVTEILIGFSGALNATEAASVAEYSLTQVGKKGSFTVKSAKKIKIKSAVYNPANDTVAITPKHFVITKKVQFLVNGLAPSGLEDSYGRLIDGNGDGQPGSDAIAIIKAKSATITSARIGSAVVDALLEQGELAAMAKARTK